MGNRMRRHFQPLGLAALLALARSAAQAAAPYFEIRVVDEATGRGVPLVELTTVNRATWITDSAGLVAFHEPGLMDRKVFFAVRSHGYAYPKDGFGNAGVALTPRAGETAQIRIRRLNIAERLYRITGQGIYRDSILLGGKAPLREPVLNAEVLGQDSAQVAVYRGKIHWFWGDTQRARYPLGHFWTAGATSELPGQGGLPASAGVDLTYFADAEGFSRPLFERPKEGLVWIDGLCVVPDATGRERMVAHYAVMKDLGTTLARGICVFNDDTALFERVRELPLDRKSAVLAAQSFRHGEHVYFASPFPRVRVRATFEDATNPDRYEAVNLPEEHCKPRDMATGRSVQLHAGSVNWNAYRRRFVMIAVEQGGTSFLGEVWYLESEKLEGPWRDAAKIVTHDKYSFYNPVHHAFFDEEGGRFIYFEGTYAETFSGNPVATPRYDYNQLMYRLDLSDSRLRRN